MADIDRGLVRQALLSRGMSPPDIDAMFTGSPTGKDPFAMQLEEPEPQQYSAPAFPSLPSTGDEVRDTARSAWGSGPVSEHVDPFASSPDEIPPEPTRRAPSAIQPAPTYSQPSGGGNPLAGIQSKMAANLRNTESVMREAQGGYDKTFDARQKAIQNSAELGEQKAAEIGAFKRRQAVEEQRYIAEEQKREGERQSAMKDRESELQNLQRDAADYKINPDRRSTGQRIMGALAMGLGAYAQAFNGGENTAAKLVMQQIDNDIAAQRDELANKRAAVGDKRDEFAILRERFGDARQAESALRLRRLEQATQALDGLKSEYEAPEMAQRRSEAQTALEQEKQNTKLGHLQAYDNAMRQGYGQLADVAARGATLGMQQRELSAKSGRGAGAPPPGLVVIPGQAPNEQATKKAQEIKGSADALMSQAKALREYVLGANGIGTEVFPTDEAKKAQAMARGLQLAIKEAFSLGALDKGAAEYMEKMVPSDPTQWRQGSVAAALDALESSVRERTSAQIRPLGFADEQTAKDSAAGFVAR
jgi:hypothetical protein